MVLKPGIVKYKWRQIAARLQSMAYIWGFSFPVHSLASGGTERMKDPRGRSSGLYSSSFTLHLSFMLRLHYIVFENKFLCLKRSLGGDALLCRLSKLFHQIFYVMTTFYYFQSTSTYTLSYGSLKILVCKERMSLWYLWSRIWLLMILILRIKLYIIF